MVMLHYLRHCPVQSVYFSQIVLEMRYRLFVCIAKDVVDLTVSAL